MSKRGLVPVNILRLAADPTTPTPITGDVYFNTVSSVLRYYNGSAWADLGGSSGSYSATVSATAPASPTTGQVWLDTTAPGLSDSPFKAAVRAATTANITLSGAQTIDGVSVVAGDRVLVKNQTAASGNGVYVAAAGAWVRATDFNVALFAASANVSVISGTVNGGTTWATSFKSTDTLGTTAMNWYSVPSYGVKVGNGSTSGNAVDFLQITDGTDRTLTANVTTGTAVPSGVCEGFFIAPASGRVFISVTADIETYTADVRVGAVVRDNTTTLTGGTLIHGFNTGGLTVGANGQDAATAAYIQASACRIVSGLTPFATCAVQMMFTNSHSATACTLRNQSIQLFPLP